jgi:hypothetical protein
VISSGALAFHIIQQSSRETQNCGGCGDALTAIVAEPAEKVRKIEVERIDPPFPTPRLPCWRS